MCTQNKRTETTRGRGTGVHKCTLQDKTTQWTGVNVPVCMRVNSITVGAVFAVYLDGDFDARHDQVTAVLAPAADQAAAKLLDVCRQGGFSHVVHARRTDHQGLEDHSACAQALMLPHHKSYGVFLGARSWVPMFVWVSSRYSSILP